MFHSHPITNLSGTEKKLLAHVKVNEVGEFHHSF